jgi:hypothetical protein
MGEFANSSAAATNYTMDAAQARAQGNTARAQAYSQAYQLEEQAGSDLSIAAENLMRMQQNKTLQLESLRAAQATSGFADSGSVSSSRSSFAQILDLSIADQMQAASSRAASMYTQANLSRRLGDQQLRTNTIAANFYDKLSSINRAAAPFHLIGQGLSTGANIAHTYNL